MNNQVDYQAEIEVMLHSGLINTFMASYLLGLNYSLLTEQLWDDALEDSAEATRAGVDSDEELKEFFDASKSLKKSAHPNTGKMYKALPKHDTLKWASLVGRIKNAIKMGFSQADAVVEASTELAVPERFDFLNWYTLQFGGDLNKYDLNQEIKEKSRQSSKYAAQGANMDITKIAEMADDRHYYLPRFRNEQPPAGFAQKQDLEVKLPGQVAPVVPTGIEQNARDFESARQKLVSRTFSIDKLLEKYKKVLSPDQVDGIEDSLNELRKKIRKLKLAVSIKDSMVKTAGIIDRLDFAEGARELMAMAADEAQMPASGAQEVSIDTISPQKKEETLTKIVEMLNTVSITLKSRDLIRNIAEIDILLDSLRMASFFPEMQDAQAKLIDAFGYASNKIEDALPKLRGGLIHQPAETIVTPVGKTDEESLQQLKDLAKKPAEPLEPIPEDPAPLPVKPEKAVEKVVEPRKPPAEAPALEPAPEEDASEQIRELQLPVRR